jgi:hypothetical protein
LVAGELEANAREMRRDHFRMDLSFPYEFQFQAWHQYAATLHAVSGPYPTLWDEVQMAYDRLLAQRESELPTPGQLDDVAAQLRVAMGSIRGV